MKERCSSVFRIEWEFAVKPGCEERFEQIYGPAGDWARLFRRGEGYLRTELHRGQQARRYRTVDFWRSRGAYEDFRKQHEMEYHTLDEVCAALTESEAEISHSEAGDTSTAQDW